MLSLPNRMKCAVLLSAAGLLAGGCASHTSGQAYPTAANSTVMPNSPASATGSGMTTPPPPPAPAAPTPPPMPVMPTKTLMVPAGARVLAAGSLPLPAFYAPPEGGNLYIYDIDAGAVDKITSYGPLTGGADSKPLNLADLPNATNNLDPTHKFRVYYVPSASATSLPTTLPGAP